MQPTYVRRNLENSIDYDFYRRQAARMRAEAVRDFGKRFRITLIAAGAVAAFAIAAAAPAHRVYCSYCTENDASTSGVPATATVGLLVTPTRTE